MLLMIFDLQHIFVHSKKPVPHLVCELRVRVATVLSAWDVTGTEFCMCFFLHSSTKKKLQALLFLSYRSGIP
jgi:hypothetical protein